MDSQASTSSQDRIVQLAAFRVGDEEYVIDIMRIREIINPVHVTAVPDGVSHIEGVINLRGAIIPIVDLRKRFRLPALGDDKRSRFIIVTLESRLVGFKVDEVLEVVRLPIQQIKTSPQLFNDREAGLFLGVCRHNERLLLLLNLKRVLGQGVSTVLGDDNSSQGFAGQ